MDIIMLRHGQTEDNVRKVFSRDGCNLTEKGEMQVKNSLKYLKELNIETIYCSPLERTRSTLKLIKSELMINTVYDNSIVEVDFGEFKGKSYNECIEIFNANVKEWEKDPFHIAPLNGESISKAYKRVKAFIDKLIKKQENVLLVTHDGVIRLVLCYVLGEYNHFFKFKVDNGSINIIKVYEGFSTIDKVNLI